MTDEPAEVPPHERFAGLTYETFRRMAADPALSPHERSGFPDEYREGSEEAILADVFSKLPGLSQQGAIVVDIGCGAGPIGRELRERCAESASELILVDSPEVLAHHPDGPNVRKVAGRFPDTPDLLKSCAERCDAVLAYSVLQYAFAEASVFAFVDAALTLLRPGGRLLLGDIPNSSMRRRFLVSEAGRAHHRQYTGRDEDPPVRWQELPHGEIDDAVTLALLARARAAGYHGWILPQGAGLPMANRREDLVFARP